MTEFEIRANAIVQELQQQRAGLGDRAMYLAADLAVARARIDVLEAELKKREEAQKPEAPV